MGWTDALTDLNTSVGDYFGETVDYESVDTLTTVSAIEDTVVDYLDAEGQAMLDLPTASVATPDVGGKLTLADASTWRIYDYGNTEWGYSECDIRSTDYWKVGTLEDNSGGTWSTHTANLPVYLDEGTATEFLDGDTYNVEIIYTGRCMYLSSLTEKMRITIGAENYYIVGVQKDASQARYLDLQLSKRKF